MTYFDAAILGIVEGLTEFLPVSSTGHLIIASYFLGIEDTDATKAFEVIIQGAAICAVIWQYRRLLWQTLKGVPLRNKDSIALSLWILIAFLPAAILGLSLSRIIKQYLFSIQTVAWALLAGGIILIAIEYFSKKASDASFASLTKSKAFLIGLAQCLALWPGISRSMATILGGRLVGLSPKAAAEFSFLLAIPTILGASIHDLAKSGPQIFSTADLQIQFLIGSVISFLTALVVIRSFLKFLGSHSMIIFGIYRIVVGLILILLFSNATPLLT